MERLIHSEYSFYDYAALIVAVSFLGFCLENLWMLFRNKQMDNRNMNFPFLLGYGLAILLIYFVLGIPTKENVLRFYITCFIGVSIGEILLGYTVEKLCHIHFWDYTSLPLHLTRYTSFFTSLGFAAIITVFFYYFFSPLMNYIHVHGSNNVHVLCISLLAALVIDFCFSFRYMYINRDFYQNWILHFPVKETTSFNLEIISK